MEGCKSALHGFWAGLAGHRYSLDMLSAVPLLSPQIDLQFGSLFTDHMVLQRKTVCRIWGTTQPGARVTVTGSWGADATATADAGGRWIATLRTAEAGGPFTVAATASVGTGGFGPKILKDVMLGEVWLCSGQSNMEMWLDNYRSPAPVVDWQKELASSANYPNIRVYQVPRLMSDKPINTVDAAWQVSSPQSVGRFSAVGFFFARKLADELKVPIGIIHPSWGGTEVELWTSEPGMRALPELGERLDAYRKNAVENVSRNAAYQEALKKFVPTEKPEWQTAEFDDSAWKPAARPAPFPDDFDGAMWYRATVEVPAELAGQTGRLKLGAIDDDDKTWVNGVLVGQTEGYDVDRNYEVKNLKAGPNKVAIRGFDGAGPGGFTGTEWYLEIDGRKLPLTGWRSFAVMNPNQPPRPNLLPTRNFSTLYNGMIAPVVPYAIKGALWYQGESNVSRAEQYQRSFPNMIRDWRKNWGIGDFSFYFVQIAPFAYTPPYGPELREAQLKSLATKNTGMAVVTDLVDNLQNIHPVQKREVGDRLALIALAKDYGMKVEYSGPTLETVRASGRELHLTFDHAEGLKGNLQGFEVAGSDGVYCDADARIQGNSVIVSSIQIPNPKTVRYGWSDTVFAGLFNSAGLPASPFRTDSLPLMTKGQRW